MWAAHSCRFCVPLGVSILVAGGELQYKKIVTVMWGSAPAEYWDDELELVEDYDPELDLLDDLYASGDD